MNGLIAHALNVKIKVMDKGSWIKRNHTEIQTVVAVFIILFGCVMATLGFYVIPLGIVDSSVLWIFGQALIAGGSLLGVAVPLLNRNKDKEEK